MSLPNGFILGGEQAAPIALGTAAFREVQTSRPIFQVPFPADPKKYLYKLYYQARLGKYNELPLDASGPHGGIHVGEGDFRDVEGVAVSFSRTFAFVPTPRDEYESYVYSYQIVDVSDDDVPVYSLNEVPLTVNSRVHYDYFQTTTPSSISLPGAPRVIVDMGLPLYLNGWDSISAGTEMLAEDSSLSRWQGNIYERKQRWIIKQALA